MIVALRAGDEALYEEALAGLSSPKLLRPVPGGATSQLSVAAGLEALAAVSPDAVLIHDAARPFIGADCISGTIAALELFDGAIAAAPVTDTLKRGEGGAIAGTVSREGCGARKRPRPSIIRESSKPTARLSKRGARISPTTRLSRNGPGSRLGSSRTLQRI